MRLLLPTRKTAGWLAVSALFVAAPGLADDNTSSRSSTMTQADCEQLTGADRIDCEKRARERTSMGSSDAAGEHAADPATSGSDSSDYSSTNTDTTSPASGTERTRVSEGTDTSSGTSSASSSYPTSGTDATSPASGTERTRVSEADRNSSSTSTGSSSSEQPQQTEDDWNQTDPSVTSSTPAGQTQRGGQTDDAPRTEHEAGEREEMLDDPEE